MEGREVPGIRIEVSISPLTYLFLSLSFLVLVRVSVLVGLDAFLPSITPGPHSILSKNLPSPWHGPRPHLTPQPAPDKFQINDGMVLVAGQKLVLVESWC